MASVVAGGLFNAVAFAGAGYIFHKLDKKGYEDEMKRHNLAMEQLKAAQDKWYEKTVEKKEQSRIITSTIKPLFRSCYLKGMEDEHLVVLL